VGGWVGGWVGISVDVCKHACICKINVFFNEIWLLSSFYKAVNIHSLL